MKRTGVERRPEVMGGQSVVTGTRMPVSVILREAANGMTPDEIADAYPAVTADQVRVALEWAAVEIAGAGLIAAE